MSLRYRAAFLTAPRMLEFKELDVPQISGNETLVKVKTVGISGTDIRMYSGLVRAKLPIVPGQEFSGEVVEVSDLVSSARVGDRVVVEPVLRCNKCFYCLTGRYTLCEDLKVLGVTANGGLAQYIAVPSYALHRLPNTLSYEEAVLTAPTAVALYAINRASAEINDTIAILGAGPIGLAALQLARLFSRKVFVVDPKEGRRGYAEKLGAYRVFDPKDKDFLDEIRKETSGQGVDFVIEASGAPEAVSCALELVRRAGRVCFTGAFSQNVPINMNTVVRKDLDVYGVWLYPHLFAKALKLIEDGMVHFRGLPTLSYGFHQAKDALEKAEQLEVFKVYVNV